MVKDAKYWEEIAGEWKKLYYEMEAENKRNKEAARELSIKLANIESGDDLKTCD